MNRRLIGACFVVLAMLAGVAQAAPNKIVPNKIDPAVVQAMAAGANPVDIIVTGLPHVGYTEGMFSSRTEAMATLTTVSTPFFNAIAGVAAETGSSVREKWAAAPAVHLLATPAAISRFTAMSEVRYIEFVAPDAVRIDPITVDEAGGQNTGGRQMIQAEDIWAMGYRGEGIKLAIIDTGVWPGHEALKNADGSSRIVAWRDFSSHNYPTPNDGNGHGTHVAGTSAGSRLYSDPVHGLFQEEGVAPRATLIAAKNLGDGGFGQWPWSISALQWAFDNGADITSNSWGGGCSSDAIAVTALVRQLTDLGMLSVFAAGNSGPGAGSIICPGRGESALTVGAVDQSRNIASFSSRGPCTDPDTGTPSRICPDVVAKGVNVRSAWPRPRIASGYNSISGTSMATPHVAGAAVLAEQMKRELTGSPFNTSARVEEALFKTTSLDLGTAGEDNTFGWGLVQLLSIRRELGPKIATALAGFDEAALPVRPQAVEFSATNDGGEVAHNLSIQVSVPTQYLFLPGSTFNPADMNTLYSDPAPSSVATSEDGMYTLLTYEVGTLDVGQSFGFTASISPLVPGDYVISVVSTFEDETGADFEQAAEFSQSVGVPA